MKNAQVNIKHELEVIKKTLKQFKDGAVLDVIKEALVLDIGLRTLQRRLDKLKEAGAVTTSGKTRATVYHLAEPEVAIDAFEKTMYGGIIPLSNEAVEIQHIVSQPVAARRPVGYNSDFLLSYRPNVDSYLTISEKARLSDLGKTARLDQPAGTYAREILQRLLIDLAWNSSRLEGNTYSLLDTQRLISQGKAADNKTSAEAQMIINHKEAIEFIVQEAEEIGYNRYTITNLHGLLSNNLLPDTMASGRLRTHGIGIGHSVFIPLSIPQQIEEMFVIMLDKARLIEDPFEQAFFVMVHLPYLQPFDDVNKRVSRLAANIPLNKYNLAPLSFVDVPNDLYVQGVLGVYENNRVELLKDVFIWAYERSSLRYAALRQSLGEPDPFRMKYREEIRSLVNQVVTDEIPSVDAAKLIAEKSQEFPAEDQARFIETVDTELLSLHEGNIARYRIRPSEFKQWKDNWYNENEE
jgi:hypothetical protein